MAERQLRQILDQLAFTPPFISHSRKASASDDATAPDTDKAKRRNSTAQSLLSSLLHPKMASTQSIPPLSASRTVSPGLSSARLNSLLDMLSFTGKRKGPPALDLAEGKRASDADDEEDGNEEQDGRALTLRRGSDSEATATPTPTDSDLSPRILDAHCVDMDQHCTLQSPSAPSPPTWRTRGKRVRFSDVVMIVG